MSADSQAAGQPPSPGTGANHLASPSLANTGIVAFCVYWKLNGWSKRPSGYDTPVSISNAAGVGSRRMVYVQQDSLGGGNAQVVQAGAVKESPYLQIDSPTILTATGIWLFTFFLIQGTTLTVWWGPETGTLNSYTDTLPGGLTATDFVEARLGSDIFGSPGVGEMAWASFRGARAWVDEAFTGTEVTAERDSSTFAPAKSTGLVNVLPLVNGTNPEVATTGSNWTLTGTFANDASNPSFGGGPPPAAPARRALLGVGA